jgi:hypothetical protein
MKPIERVAILTRDRPASASHVLDTAAALGRGERRVELIVVDDSRAPAARTEIAARLDGGRGRGGVSAIYLGHAERRRLADALVAGGIEPAVVELALFDPFGLDSTPGACRNFLHLWSASRPFLSVDDDMPLEAGVPPGARGATLEVGEGDPTRFWFFDREPELPASSSADALLAGHESLLGRTAAGAARALGVDLRAPRSEGFARRAEREPIVATWTGFAGDVATPNVLAYLKQRGESRRSLVRNASFYRRAFASRQVIRAPRGPSVADGSFWSTGVTAYDPTALLPPFLPALRGEGLVFGALVRASSGVLGYLPIVVPHRPPEVRCFDRVALEQSAASFALSTLLVRWLHRHRRTADHDPTAALRAAGEHLRELAAGDADRFAARVRAERQRYVIDVATELTRCLADADETAGPWVDDVERYLEVAEWAAHSTPGAPTDVPDPARARRFVLAFADLVRAWPDVVAVARDASSVRESDRSPA